MHGVTISTPGVQDDGARRAETIPYRGLQLPSSRSMFGSLSPVTQTSMTMAPGSTLRSADAADLADFVTIRPAE